VRLPHRLFIHDGTHVLQGGISTGAIVNLSEGVAPIGVNLRIVEFILARGKEEKGDELMQNEQVRPDLCATCPE
jgi:hypothetical protein